jgi:hypothetical protein
MASIIITWGTKMRLNIILTAVAATLIVTPAAAQQRTATGEARGTVLSPISLQNIAPLDFGTVASTNTADFVDVNANTGIRTAGPNVVLVPSTPSRARFDGLGQGGQTIVLSLTPPTGNIITSGGGATITVNSMSLDQGGLATRVIAPGGSFSVYVGGNFQIAANQPNGVYTGNFTLTANYQ